MEETKTSEAPPPARDTEGVARPLDTPAVAEPAAELAETRAEPRKTAAKRGSTLLGRFKHHEFGHAEEAAKAAKTPKERWYEALSSAADEVLEGQGYTSGELSAVRAALKDIESRCRNSLMNKCRRIMRAAVARELGKDSRALKKKGFFLNLVTSESSRHGIVLGDSSTAQQASVFDAKLRDLFEDERVLENLTKTLVHVAAKKRFGLKDGIKCLFVSKILTSLLNLPGGIQYIFSERHQRLWFSRICKRALLCKVPLVTKAVLKLLTRLSQLPQELDADSLTIRCLDSVRQASKWGAPICSPLPFAASPFIAQRGVLGKPPRYAAVAQLLVPDDFHADDLRAAVLDLFSAMCSTAHRNHGLQAALLLQTRLFHAILCAVPCDAKVPGADDTLAGVCAPLAAVRDSCDLTDSDSVLLRVSLDRFFDAFERRLRVPAASVPF